MLIRPKDACKLFGVSILAFCAVFVCTIFLNFSLDLKEIRPLIDSPDILLFYEAQVSMGKATCAISGGCLLATTAVMLFFYIKQYIDQHRQEMGVLKALGYSSMRLAKRFWIFSLSVLAGTALGFAGSYLLMPVFYREMTKDHILPDVTLQVHPVLAVWLVLLPTLLFGALSVGYARWKLQRPVLSMIREQEKSTRKNSKRSGGKSKQRDFLQQLKTRTVKSRPALLFFILFAAFCYSSMIQMTLVMREIASPLFAVMIGVIGIVLASVSLILAVTTVVRSNAKAISLMKALGYSSTECGKAVLSGYRPWAYLGFAVGTVYQYVLIKSMMRLFDATAYAVDAFSFSKIGFVVTLLSFLLAYELILHRYTVRMERISVKEMMLE